MPVEHQVDRRLCIVVCEDGACAHSFPTLPHVCTCIYIHTWYLRCHKSKSSNTYIHYFDECAVCPLSKLQKLEEISLMIPKKKFFFLKSCKCVLTVTPTGKKISSTSTTSWGGNFFFRSAWAVSYRGSLRLHIIGPHRRLRLVNRTQDGVPGFGTDPQLLPTVDLFKS